MTTEEKLARHEEVLRMTEAMFWERVNVETMRDLLTDNASANAQLWRFLQTALARGEVFAIVEEEDVA